MTSHYCEHPDGCPLDDDIAELYQAPDGSWWCHGHKPTT